MAKPSRPGASRGKKKGATKGSGGQRRKSLEGRGPTPKAEDRPYHPAAKRKASAERAASRSRGSGRETKRRGSGDAEVITGRNAVVEALRSRVPATALYIAQRVEMDERIKEALSVADRKSVV